jgi:hypothetical protein
VDISLGQAGESHDRLGLQASSEGKLKGNPIDWIVPHWLLRAAPWFFLRPASSSPVPIISCISCSKPLEKPLNYCGDPLKSVVLEGLLTSPIKAGFKNMEAVSTVHLMGPDTSSGQNMKPFERSPLETGNRDGLQNVGLIGL